ncbi:MAG: hypothetical protein V5A72_00045 [Candidatus Nanohaloarchaea archaeon]
MSREKASEKLLDLADNVEEEEDGDTSIEIEFEQRPKEQNSIEINRPNGDKHV